MRKYIIIIVAVLMAEVCLAQDKTQWGIKVGTGHTFIDFPEQYPPKQHFSLNGTAGLTFDYLFNEHISLATEATLYFRSTHTEINIYVPAIFVSPEASPDETINIHDITRSHQVLGRIPLLCRYRWDKLQLSAGPLAEYIIKGWNKTEHKGYSLLKSVYETEENEWFTHQERRFVVGGELQARYALTFLNPSTFLGLSLSRNFTDYHKFGGLNIKQPKNVDVNIFLTFEL